jgi:hypothetical protein
VAWGLLLLSPSAKAFSWQDVLAQPVSPTLARTLTKAPTLQVSPCSRLTLSMSGGNGVFIDQAYVDQALANRAPGAIGPLVSLSQPGTRYCLTTDVLDPRPLAQLGLNVLFQIDANDVTFDLNGHTIRGRLASGYQPMPTAAIAVGSASNARIEHGSIRRFSYGIYGNTLANAQSGVEVEGLIITNPRGMGVVLNGFTNVLIRNNIINDVYKGIHVLFHQRTWVPELTEILENEISVIGEGPFRSPYSYFTETTSSGIWAEVAQVTRVRGNRVTLDPGVDGRGIELSETRWRPPSVVDAVDVEGNEIDELGEGTGILVENSPGLRMVDNLVRGAGIARYQEGIRIENSLDTVVEFNLLCTLNIGVEFYAKGTGRTTAARVTGNEFFNVLMPWSNQAGVAINYGSNFVYPNPCGVFEQ